MSAEKRDEGVSPAAHEGVLADDKKPSFLVDEGDASSFERQVEL
jgi:hypothetical protein